MRDSHIRSITKALSWRFIAFIVTGFVAWALTANITLGIVIGFSDSLIKIFAYYIHERIWEVVKFGRNTSSLVPNKGDIT